MAVLALRPGVQPDPVIAAAVRARLTLHQAPPDQPPEGAGDQGLADGEAPHRHAARWERLSL
ncbi:hypothetical protein ACFXMT_47260 [Streptomyces mirabilis]|uniref:hypothetical protein n=1 Tax=Streptomyces mirabilis TaxID=68239 RepID=UPI0036B30C13